MYIKKSRKKTTLGWEGRDTEGRRDRDKIQKFKDQTNEERRKGDKMEE